MNALYVTPHGTIADTLYRAEVASKFERIVEPTRVSLHALPSIGWTPPGSSGAPVYVGAV